MFLAILLFYFLEIMTELYGNVGVQKSYKKC